MHQAGLPATLLVKISASKHQKQPTYSSGAAKVIKNDKIIQFRGKTINLEVEG